MNQWIISHSLNHLPLICILVFAGLVFATLKHSSRRPSVPTKLFQADRRTVVCGGDPCLHPFEVLVAVETGVGTAPAGVRMRPCRQIQKILLLCVRQIHKVRFVPLCGAGVEPRQRSQKFMLCLRWKNRQNKIEEPVHESGLCPRRIRGGNDGLAKRDQSFILLCVEKDRSPIWPRQLVPCIVTRSKDQRFNWNMYGGGCADGQ